MSFTPLDSRTIKKTRKPHRCDWCNEPIEVGSSCEYRVYIFDGFGTDYMHPECNEAMNKSKDFPLDEGWLPGEFKRGQIATY
jgi:hypothetical protein